MQNKSTIKIIRDKWNKPIREGEGSIWFRKFINKVSKLDSNIRVKRIKLGFYRLYWRRAYLHEVFKNMPVKGYDFEHYDPRFENKSYYEQYEDRAELTRKIKNCVEGYYDSLKTLLLRAYQMRNDKEFNEHATRAYSHMVIR